MCEPACACAPACPHPPACVCTCACVCVCVCVCACVRVHLPVHVRLCACVHVRLRMRVHVRVHLCAYACVRLRLRACAPAPACVCACMRLRLRACAPACVCAAFDCDVVGTEIGLRPTGAPPGLAHGAHIVRPARVCLQHLVHLPVPDATPPGGDKAAAAVALLAAEAPGQWMALWPAWPRAAVNSNSDYSEADHTLWLCDRPSCRG